MLFLYENFLGDIVLLQDSACVVVFAEFNDQYNMVLVV